MVTFALQKFATKLIVKRLLSQLRVFVQNYIDCSPHFFQNTQYLEASCNYNYNVEGETHQKFVSDQKSVIAGVDRLAPARHPSVFTKPI